ncbi:hypothetical protein H0Z60_01155 [Ectothiorhodospiraceae bacterium WFHF3C12]|nr:hypothetical protein [Ectothiorhodospiraceae bacterium WFHF3C12]
MHTSNDRLPRSLRPAVAAWRRWLFMFAAILGLAACGDGYHGDLKPELTEALEGKWAPILAANKIGRVDFDGSRMTVNYGVSGDVDGDVDATAIPNYSDDPVAFTVLVHRVPGGPDMEVYADFEQPPYRLYRVRQDMDELLHHAMTLFLRSRNILDD